MKAFIFKVFVLFILINISLSDTIEIKLNEKIKNSLSDQTYTYYKLVIPELPKIRIRRKFLLIEARKNEEQDFLDNIFSDPNLYISTEHTTPDPNHSTWSSNRFGDEIISIDSKYITSGATFYISVYCQFKCNYILDAKLYDTYVLRENKIYTVSLIKDGAIKVGFKSRKDYNKLMVNCISSEMKPFRIFLAKNSPSSSNTIKSYPIFINGYYFEIKKNDPEYASNQEYEVLIENKEYAQNLLFWITYENDEVALNELSSIFGVGSPDSPNCYIFNIGKGKRKKNIVISTTLMNGNGYIKIGGWVKPKKEKILKEDKDTFPIIGDKSILLTENDYKRYNESSINSKNNYKLHFCFIATEETSYTIKIYYQENVEKAQKVNFLLPGINSDDILPGKTITKYYILDIEQNKDINIDLRAKSGKPKLYAYISYDDFSYINKKTLDRMKKTNELIYPSEISFGQYRIEINKLENKCILNKEYNKKKCSIYAVIECSTEENCLYNLIFDHTGDLIIMKPKALYSNVITKNEKDLYQIRINDENIKNFAVILNQITGNSKLKIVKFKSNAGTTIALENTEKFNQNYMPNVIEVKSKDFPGNNLKGIFELNVIGESFSSYNIYYYTFDDNTSHELDHKAISMTLIKGKIIQDYIKNDYSIKVYSYDNSNLGNNKIDLFIHFSGDLYNFYNIYVFKNLNDYKYEKERVTGYIWGSEYNKNYIYITKNEPKYIIGNLYIMIFKNKNNQRDNNIIYREQTSNISYFSLAITDELTPLTLIEGVEFKQTLTKSHPSQYYYYNHHNYNENFIFSLVVPAGKIKLSLKIGFKDYIYEKVITNNYYLNIKSNEIISYCPSENMCNIEIKVEAINLYDNYGLFIIVLCKSSLNSIIQLKTGMIEKRKILKNEKQFFIVEANPSPEMGVKINAFFTYGCGVLYAKKVKKVTMIDQSDFPNEEQYEYISSNVYNEKISNLNIPYKDVENIFPCALLVTVKGTFDYLGQSEDEYSISLSNVIDDLIPNKNYRLFISSGEMKYFRFIIRGYKTRLSISMTNKEVDAYLYLNYGTIMNEKLDNFNWKSEGSYNEYIDISVDDSYFVSRKMKNIDGEYFLAIRGLGNTYFNLYISDLDIKLTTITEEFPGVCNCENVNDICYFRYENINSPEIKEIMPQEMIFYFEFTYGSANIYASVYEDGNNGKIIGNLPSEKSYDFKSQASNQFLRIKLKPQDKKYTLESVLVLATKCKDKALFDFNVRPLISSAFIKNEHLGIIFLDINKDNIFYISSKSETPVLLALYSTSNLDISMEAKALSGSANINYYIDNSYSGEEDKENQNKKKRYKKLSAFNVEENDLASYFETISAENSYKQNIFFEIKAKIDCLFSIHLNYEQKLLFIPMNKKVQTQIKDGKLYTYIELLKEYEEVIFTATVNYIGSDFTIYAKTSIVNNINLDKMFRYSAPSSNNYDIKTSSNTFTSSLNIKIKNIPKDLYKKNNKVISIFYFEKNSNNTFEDKINIIAYPNVNNYERIFPEQKKYTYSSLSSINKDKTIFTLKKKNINDDLLIIEISSCKGNFGFELTENLPINDLNSPKIVDAKVSELKGKKMIFAKLSENNEYYLSVYGMSEDQMIFNENNNNIDIDFLLYYYTIKNNEYVQTEFSSKMEYEVIEPGKINLNLPNLEEIKSQTKSKVEDLTISVIITTDLNEFNYMDSICYLTKKYDFITSNNIYQNYTIDVNIYKNKVEINNLNPEENYYLNVLLTNKKTGEILALNPLQIIPNKKFSTNFIVIILVIGIIILLFVMFYFHRKYRIAKAIFNYEKNDIKNMGSIPKSITELKKIQEMKNKQSKEKYNSLTEDPGQI